MTFLTSGLWSIILLKEMLYEVRCFEIKWRYDLRTCWTILSNCLMILTPDHLIIKHFASLPCLFVCLFVFYCGGDYTELFLSACHTCSAIFCPRSTYQSSFHYLRCHFNSRCRCKQTLLSYLQHHSTYVNYRYPLCIFML